MKNTTNKTAAATALAAMALASCSLVFSRGIDGCMYQRGFSVHVKCINDMLDYNQRNPDAGYPLKRLRECAILTQDSTASASSTLFVDGEGRQGVKPACLFEGKSSRNYYRYEKEEGRLYVRYLSCNAGCSSISDAYEIKIEEGTAKTRFLGTYKE